jgi:hypothetical protein
MGPYPWTDGDYVASYADEESASVIEVDAIDELPRPAYGMEIEPQPELADLEDEPRPQPAEDEPRPQPAEDEQPIDDISRRSLLHII